MKYIMIMAILGLQLNNPVWAETTTNNVKSTASLSGKCEVTANNINLGEIIPGQASSSATSNFTVKCTKSTSFRYYVGITQWGYDCMYLSGQNKGDKILYAVKDLQTNTIAANNYTGTANGGYSTTSVGTGNIQTLSFKAEIQTKDFDFSVCASKIQSPGIGYNPFVTPDTYSDTMIFGIIY